jgi:hypothetical protein
MGHFAPFASLGAPAAAAARCRVHRAPPDPPHALSFAGAVAQLAEPPPPHGGGAAGHRQVTIRCTRGRGGGLLAA